MLGSADAVGFPSTMTLSDDDDHNSIQRLVQNEPFMHILRSIKLEDRELYYEVRDHIKRKVLELEKRAIDLERDRTKIDIGTEKVLAMERKLLREFRTYQKRIPLTIWYCCRRSCFSILAATDLFMIFDELLNIQEIAQYHRDRVGDASYFVQTRKKGIGKSNIAGCFPGKKERDLNLTTNRKAALQGLSSYVIKVLPFMCGKTESRKGVPRMSKKLCVHVISCLLGVSNNFIYSKRAVLGEYKQANAQEFYESIIDTTGTRIRIHRLVGKRTGYPSIAELPRYKCGCEEPCLQNIPSELLQKWYKEFCKCSEAFYPRRKENQYLLSHLQCPLMNKTVSYCNDSLSAIFTVSESRIANVRCILNYVNSNPSIDSAPTLEDAKRGYRYSRNHPMSKLRREVREKIETYLDMALRPDPGASDGLYVFRVYSPEINTQEKLRKLLADQLRDDEILVNPISSSTLQRMIQDYLSTRSCKISFTQSDHNACTNCESMLCAVLQFNMEKKKLNHKLVSLQKELRPVSKQVYEAITRLEEQCKLRKTKIRRVLVFRKFESTFGEMRVFEGF